MPVVSNSSPLIFLARLGKLDLLQALFGKVFIPEEVYSEVVEKGIILGMPEAARIRDATGKWIEVVKVSKKRNGVELRRTLHKGEVDAILLAIDKSLPALLDERPGTKAARVLGVETIGTLRVILMAFEKDLLTLKESKALIDELVTTGFRLSAQERERALNLFEIVEKGHH